MKRLLAAVVGLCLIATGASSFWQSRLQVSVSTVAAPVNTVAPATTTPSVQAAFGVQGQSLTTSNGTWTGSPTFTYQWNRTGSPISGATASSYTVQSADDGLAITCTVTGTNGGGSASASSSNTITGIEGTVVLNESFATADGWGTGGGYAVTGNAMVMTAVSAFSFTSKALTLTASDTYRIIWTITALSSGNVITGVNGGSFVSGTLRTAPGTYTENIVAPASPTTILMQVQATTTGSFTNVLMVQR